jgi:2,4'-dihydroxyacetophenone dioxygenase
MPEEVLMTIRPVGPKVPVSTDVPLEIAVAAVPADDRVWVPQAPDVWFRPLMFNTIVGQWCNLLKVTRSGIVSRHRHPGAVFGYVLTGAWKYHEHEWTADAGSFVYEPPGEIHTLAVPEHCTEMITFFNITGAMIYLDEEGRQIGYEDTFTKIDMCRRHYADVGLGADYVDRFIR